MVSRDELLAQIPLPQRDGDQVAAHHNKRNRDVKSFCFVSNKEGHGPADWEDEEGVETVESKGIFRHESNHARGFNLGIHCNREYCHDFKHEGRPSIGWDRVDLASKKNRTCCVPPFKDSKEKTENQGEDKNLNFPLENERSVLRYKHSREGERNKIEWIPLGASDVIIRDS